MKQDLFHNAWWFEAGQAFFQAAALEEELLMVKSQKVQDRGVKVVDADGILDGRVAEFVGLAVTRSTLDSATGHPRGEGLHIVIPARVARCGLLRCRSPTELAAPDDER